MNQPTPSLERPIGNPEYLAPMQWRKATSIVNGLRADEAFIQRLEAQWLDPADTATLKHAETFALYAEDYCSVTQLAGELDQCHADQIRLLANAPLFVRSQDELAHYGKQRKIRHFPLEESSYYQNYKPFAIWYNQLLARYAYSNPSDTTTNLNNALIQQTPPDLFKNQKLIADRITNSTRGARTEAITRHLFDLAGAKYVPGTHEEDLKGGDFIVMYNGHRVKVDIKSSLHAIAELRGGYEKIKNEYLDYAIRELKQDNGKKTRFVIVLFAGFTDADCGDSLSLQLPTEEIMQHAESLKSQLDTALAELWPKR